MYMYTMALLQGMLAGFLWSAAAMAVVDYPEIGRWAIAFGGTVLTWRWWLFLPVDSAVRKPSIADECS